MRFAFSVRLPKGEKPPPPREAGLTRDNPLQQVFALAPRVFREVRRTSEFAHHVITFHLFVAAYLLLGALNSLLAFLFVSVIFGISFGCPLLFMHIQRFKNRSVHRCFHRQFLFLTLHAHQTLQKQVSPQVRNIHIFSHLYQGCRSDFQ